MYRKLLTLHGFQVFLVRNVPKSFLLWYAFGKVLSTLISYLEPVHPSWLHMQCHCMMLATHRAIKGATCCPAGTVKYLYPFQTPISDFGAQRKRVEAIRQKLGWRKLGCELKECFE